MLLKAKYFLFLFIVYLFSGGCGSSPDQTTSPPRQADTLRQVSLPEPAEDTVEASFLNPLETQVEVYHGFYYPEDGPSINMALELKFDKRRYEGRWLGWDIGPDQYGKEFQGEIRKYKNKDLFVIPIEKGEFEDEIWGIYQDNCKCFGTEYYVPPGRKRRTLLARMHFKSLDDFIWSAGGAFAWSGSGGFIDDNHNFISFAGSYVSPGRYRDHYKRYFKLISGKRDSLEKAFYADIESLEENSEEEDLQLGQAYDYISYADSFIISGTLILYNALGEFGNCNQQFTFNLDRRNHRMFDIRDLLLDKPETWEFLSRFCRNAGLFTEISLSDRKESGFFDLVDSATAPRPENFENFRLTQEGLEFVYNPNDVSKDNWVIHCAGEVAVPWEIIEDYFDPRGPMGTGTYGPAGKAWKKVPANTESEKKGLRHGVNGQGEILYLGAAALDGVTLPVSLKLNFSENAFEGTLSLGTYEETGVSGEVMVVPGSGAGLFEVGLTGEDFVSGDSLTGEMLDIRYDDDGNFYSRQGFRLHLTKGGKRSEEFFLAPFSE